MYRGRAAGTLLPDGEHPGPVQPHQTSADCRKARRSGISWQAFWPTGYVKFVKMFEFIGGIVVMIPRLRNIGLLLLGPVIVNIIAFHVLVDDPKELLDSNRCGSSVIVFCALYLLWEARTKFAGLLN